MGLLTALASLLGIETEAIIARLKESAVAVAAIALFALIAVTFLLVALYTSAHVAGCELKLASPNERVKHVLEITKLYPILGVYQSEEKALASLPRRASA